MTNAEKYLKEGVSVEELIKQLYEIQDYKYNTNMFNCKKFFEEKATPTLDERVKEMVYTKEPKREVLATGYCFGLLYYVLSLGTHPTAYVKIPKDNWLCTVEHYDDIPIECHGGITFRANHLCIADNQAIDGEFIGWDYAHCTDYDPYYDEVFSKDTHKWTTKEILEEVKEVCSQIVELGKKPHLTEDERVILRNIKGYTTIIRNIEGNIQAENNDGSFACLCAFNHLFQFIKERRKI